MKPMDIDTMDIDTAKDELVASLARERELRLERERLQDQARWQKADLLALSGKLIKKAGEVLKLQAENVRLTAALGRIAGSYAWSPEIEIARDVLDFFKGEQP